MAILIFVSACSHPHPHDIKSTAVVVSLKADPATIAKSRAATLRWEARNTDSVFIMPDVGRVFRANSVYAVRHGTLKVQPDITTTYVATAWGPNGSARSSTTVTVSEPTTESVIGSYRWNHNEVIPRFQEVTFEGELLLSAGGHGETGFSIIGGAQVVPGLIAEVHFSMTGLKPGRWKITAVPSGSLRSVTCKMTVPGVIRLSATACSF